MQIANRVAINTGILYARMIVTIGISLYTTRVTLIALGVESFGTFNLVLGIVSTLSFLGASMMSATQRYISYVQGEGNKKKLIEVFNASMTLHFLTSILLIFIMEIVGWLIFKLVLNISQEQETAWIIYQLMIVVTSLTTIALPYDAIITSRENMLLFSIISLLEAILKLGIAFFILNNYSNRLLIYGILISALSIFTILLKTTYCHYKYSECVLAPFKYWNKKIAKEISIFAGWSLLGSASSMIAFNGQGILLNSFFGTKANAAQGVASQITGQLGALAASMLKALNPVITKSEGAGNRKLMLRVSELGNKLGFFLLLPLFIPAIIEMPFLLKIWLNSVPLYSVEFCRLLLARHLIEQLFYSLNTMIYAVGNIRNFQIISSIINIGPLITSYGLFYFGAGPDSIYYVLIRRS